MKEFIEKLITRLEKDNRIGRKSFEAIVDDINQLAESHHIHCEQEYMKGYEDARKNVGWIPVSERLPEKDRYVLCQGVNGLFIACIDSMDDKWRDTHFYTRSTILAWQPLPAPYKEGCE